MSYSIGIHLIEYLYDYERREYCQSIGTSCDAGVSERGGNLTPFNDSCLASMEEVDIYDGDEGNTPRARAQAGLTVATGAGGQTHPGHVALHEDLAVEALALVRAQCRLQLRARQGKQLVTCDSQLALRVRAEALHFQPVRDFIRIRFLSNMSRLLACICTE